MAISTNSLAPTKTSNAVGFRLDGYGRDYAFLAMAVGSFMSFLLVAAIKEPVARRNA